MKKIRITASLPDGIGKDRILNYLLRNTNLTELVPGSYHCVQKFTNDISYITRSKCGSTYLILNKKLESPAFYLPKKEDNRIVWYMTDRGFSVNNRSSKSRFVAKPIFDYVLLALGYKDDGSEFRLFFDPENINVKTFRDGKLPKMDVDLGIMDNFFNNINNNNNGK